MATIEALKARIAKASAKMEAPTKRDDLVLVRYDIREPPVFRSREVGLVPSCLFPSDVHSFCAVQDGCANRRADLYKP